MFMNLIKSLAIFCLAVILSSSLQAADTGTVRAFKITGNVTLKHDDTGKVTPLELGKGFGQGYTVITGKKSSVLLVFSNGSTINLDEKSSLSVSEFMQEKFDKTKGTYLDLQADPSVSKTELQLNYGELAFHVKKLSNGSSFNVNTEVGSAGIRGTRGKVSVIKVGNTVRVKVVNRDGSVVWLQMMNGRLQSDNAGKTVQAGTALNFTKNATDTGGTVTPSQVEKAELDAIKDAVDNIDENLREFVEAVLELEVAQETGDQEKIDAAAQKVANATKKSKKGRVFSGVDFDSRDGEVDLIDFDESVKDALNNQTNSEDTDTSSTYLNLRF
jgi:hypothetical protein